jgi:hypothetical protein
MLGGSGCTVFGLLYRRTRETRSFCCTSNDNDRAGREWLRMVIDKGREGFLERNGRGFCELVGSAG